MADYTKFESLFESSALEPYIHLVVRLGHWLESLFGVGYSRAMRPVIRMDFGAVSRSVGNREGHHLHYVYKTWTALWHLSVVANALGYGELHFFNMCRCRPLDAHGFSDPEWLNDERVQVAEIIMLWDREPGTLNGCIKRAMPALKMLKALHEAYEEGLYSSNEDAERRFRDELWGEGLREGISGRPVGDTPADIVLLWLFGAYLCRRSFDEGRPFSELYPDRRAGLKTTALRWASAMSLDKRKALLQALRSLRGHDGSGLDDPAAGKDGGNVGGHGSTARHQRGFGAYERHERRA